MRRRNPGVNWWTLAAVGALAWLLLGRQNTAPAAGPLGTVEPVNGICPPGYQLDLLERDRLPGMPWREGDRPAYNTRMVCWPIVNLPVDAYGQDTAVR